MKILLPHEVAKACFLIEALLYRAVGRLPLAPISADEDDADMPIDDTVVLTPEECTFGGLPPDPEWEENETGEGERLSLGLAGSDKQRKTAHEEWLKWKYTKEGRRNEWSRGFQELLKRYHTEFLTALREGQLRSHGQEPGQLEEDMAHGSSWREVPWKGIPSTFWVSCEIEWGKNKAKGATAAYESIVVDTDDLFRVFPLPAPQEPTGVRKIGNYLVLSDEVADPSGNLGRRPFRWNDFYLELARRVVAGELPDKQEAGIEDMQDWCKEQWGYKPARSTLLQKITPYYDEFVRSKKVRK
jgi:hypothetical protein